MTSNPMISVLMPVYNGGAYLRQAIESILNQSFTDFEFIIVDDGSTDTTVEIIHSYTDERIIYLHNDARLGIVKALNRGLRIARAEYIARMDADDISLPQRLERQMAYLGRHPEVGLLGSWYEWTDDFVHVLCTIMGPQGHALIAWNLLFSNCFMHGSVIFKRSSALEAGGYTLEYVHGEDYGLWANMAVVTRMAILSQALVKRRDHPNTVARLHVAQQRDTRARIMKRIISDVLGEEIGVDFTYSLVGLLEGGRPGSGFELENGTDLLQRLCIKFVLKRPLDSRERRDIRRDAIEKICNVAYRNTGAFPKEAIYAAGKALFLSPLWTSAFLLMKVLQSLFHRLRLCKGKSRLL